MVETLTELNRRINEWGYTDDIPQFLDTFKAEHAAARTDSESWQNWLAEKGRWVQDADDILVDIRQFIVDGWLEGLSSEVVEVMWEKISATVWRIQYMGVVLQVYLDLRL